MASFKDNSMIRYNTVVFNNTEGFRVRLLRKHSNLSLKHNIRKTEGESKSKTIFPRFERKKIRRSDSVEIIQKLFIKNKRQMESYDFLSLNQNKVRKKAVVVSEKEKDVPKAQRQQIQPLKHNPQDLIFRNITSKVTNKHIAFLRKNKRAIIKRLSKIGRATPSIVKKRISVQKIVKEPVKKKLTFRARQSLPQMLNYCDFYLEERIRNCFILGDNYSFNTKEYRFTKITSIQYKEYMQQIIINNSKDENAFIVNAEISDYHKMIQLRLNPPNFNPKKRFSKEKKPIFHKIKSKFSSLKKGCSIERTISVIKMKKNRKKKRLYMSQWLKIIKKLLDSKDLKEKNLIGYYDIKLAEKKKYLKYIVYDETIPLSHFDYFLDKIRDDINNDEKQVKCL